MKKKENLLHHQAAPTDVGTPISRSRWTNGETAGLYFPFSSASLNETHRLRSHTLLVVRNPIHTAPGAAETCDSMQTERQADDDNNSSVSNLIAATANTNTKRQTNRDAALRVGCGRLCFGGLHGADLASGREDTCRCAEAA